MMRAMFYVNLDWLKIKQFDSGNSKRTPCEEKVEVGGGEFRQNVTTCDSYLRGEEVLSEAKQPENVKKPEKSH